MMLARLRAAAPRAGRRPHALRRRLKTLAVQETGGTSRARAWSFQERDGGTVRCEAAAAAGGEKEETHTPTLHHLVFKHFLPRDYPRSVRPGYARYVRLQMAQSVLSSMGGVLSTQSLLFAVGLGASTALPAAAALNWVLKDGLGQLGGVVFASFISNRFDANPKRWRMGSVSFVAAATAVEILTPLVPHLFVPLASLANMCKNVSWLSASATKASIHKSFLRAENLADLTAKAGSQGIAASLAGTAGGIALSALIGHDTFRVLAVYSCMAAAGLALNYAALRGVALPTLNRQRADLATAPFLRGAAWVPTPDEARRDERFLAPYRSPLDDAADIRIGGVALDEVCPRAGDLARLCAAHPRDRYLLRVLGRRVTVLLHESARDADVLHAFLHASAVRTRLAAGDDADKAVAEAAEWAAAHVDEYLAALRSAGWQVEHTFLEKERTRIRVLCDEIEWPRQ